MPYLTLLKVWVEHVCTVGMKMVVAVIVVYIMTLGEWNTRTQPKYKWKDQYEWMNAHAKMYRGDNSSDCMMNAFNAGRELKGNE